MKTPLPILPVVRFEMYQSEVLGESTFVLRQGPSKAAPPDAPDVIALGRHGPFSASLHLSPAMLVHLANTMLTDEERAAVNVPATCEDHQQGAQGAHG